MHPVLEKLFLKTRDAKRSLTTKVFQNFSIGSENYKNIYCEKPILVTESYLKKFDIPLVSDQSISIIKGIINNDQSYVALYTARPSLPPREIGQPLLGYSPEAEIAADLNELPSMPLIGLGKLAYWADKNDMDPEKLLKPSPYQALAAIVAAMFDNELFGIEFAFDLYWRDQHFRINELIEFLKKGNDDVRLNINVFEDSLSGIQAGKKSAEYLCSLGIETHFSAWGVSKDIPKIDVLEKNGIEVYEDINQALSTVALSE